MNTIEDKIKAVMLGHAVGDALGVPVEFCTREELDANPVAEMRGWGSYPMPEGCWSDDTSMSLATLDSLIGGRVELDDIMTKFGEWYYDDKYTPTGEMFDVGNTCSCAIENHFKNHKSVEECGLTGERSNGNGSLMRIHPVALYLFFSGKTGLEGISIIHSVSGLTHAHQRSKIACGIYSFILWELLRENRWCGNLGAIRRGLYNARKHYGGDPEFQHFAYKLCRQIADINHIFEDVDTFKKVGRDDIRSGGYVVDTLEAAVWCLMTTDNYKDCVLKAVNLGDDTDTVAAVAGGFAGALYGLDSIPTEWLDVLKRRDYIEEMCEQASENWKKV